MHRLKRLMGAPVRKNQTGAVRGFASASLLALSCALVLTLGATQSQAHPPSEWEAEQEALAHKKQEKTTEALAGKAPNSWQPKTYNYGTFVKDGKSYTVKTDNHGKSYIKINGNWFDVKSKPELNIVPPAAPISPRAPIAPEVHADVIPVTPPAPRPAPAPEATPFVGNKWEADNNQYVMAEVSRKQAEDQAELARELAEERAELARELAQEQAELSREWANEQAEYQRELAEKQAEHAREMAEYQREIQAHQHEIERNHSGHDEHAKEHAKQQAELKQERAREQKEHALEMKELQRELAQEQKEHAREMAQAQKELAREQANMKREQSREYAERVRENKEHQRAEKERRKADRQAKKYEQMRERLIPQLTRDGFMKSENTKITMKLTEQDIYINGQKLSNSLEGEYCDIVSDYIERKGDVKKIVFKPGYMHVEAKSSTGRSSYTFNETDEDW